MRSATRVWRTQEEQDERSNYQRKLDWLTYCFHMESKLKAKFPKMTQAQVDQKGLSIWFGMSITEKADLFARLKGSLSHQLAKKQVRQHEKIRLNEPSSSESEQSYNSQELDAKYEASQEKAKRKAHEQYEWRSYIDVNGNQRLLASELYERHLTDQYNKSVHARMWSIAQMNTECTPSSNRAKQYLVQNQRKLQQQRESQRMQTDVPIDRDQIMINRHLCEIEEQQDDDFQRNKFIEFDVSDSGSVCDQKKSKTRTKKEKKLGKQVQKMELQRKKIQFQNELEKQNTSRGLSEIFTKIKQFIPTITLPSHQQIDHLHNHGVMLVHKQQIQHCYSEWAIQRLFEQFGNDTLSCKCCGKEIELYSDLQLHLNKKHPYLFYLFKRIENYSRPVWSIVGDGLQAPICVVDRKNAKTKLKSIILKFPNARLVKSDEFSPNPLNFSDEALNQNNKGSSTYNLFDQMMQLANESTLEGVDLKMTLLASLIASKRGQLTNYQFLSDHITSGKCDTFLCRKLTIYSKVDQCQFVMCAHCDYHETATHKPFTFDVMFINTNPFNLRQISTPTRIVQDEISHHKSIPIESNHDIDLEEIDVNHSKTVTYTVRSLFKRIIKQNLDHYAQTNHFISKSQYQQFEKNIVNTVNDFSAIKCQTVVCLDQHGHVKSNAIRKDGDWYEQQQQIDLDELYSNPRVYASIQYKHPHKSKPDYYILSMYQVQSHDCNTFVMVIPHGLQQIDIMEALRQKREFEKEKERQTEIEMVTKEKLIKHCQQENIRSTNQHCFDNGEKEENADRLYYEKQLDAKNNKAMVTMSTTKHANIVQPLTSENVNKMKKSRTHKN